MKDYYSILKISKTASTSQIKAAYRNLSKTYHPDLNKNPNTTILFIEIKEAYEVLIDDNRRNHYNQILDFALNKEKQNINVTPHISFFYCDKADFSIGDTLTFSWEVFDADLVELRPFGRISKSGTKKIKITEVSTNLLVELFCFNSISRSYVFSQIILKRNENIVVTSTASFNQEDYQNLFSAEKDSDYERLIRNYPEIDHRNLEKEKLFSLFGRIGRKTYRQRIFLFTSVYSLFVAYFVSEGTLDSFQSLLLNSLYYTLVFIQSVKRFHDMNSRGNFAFISAIPIIGFFQCFYLSTKQGNSDVNTYGLPNDVLLKDNSNAFKQKVKNRYKQFSKLEKFSLATICFNFFMVFLFFIIPKTENVTEVFNQFSRNIKNRKINETHYFIETVDSEFEISEKMYHSLLLTNPKLVHLGVNPLTNNVSFVRLKQGDHEMTHYLSVVNFNSPMVIVYVIFLMFQFYVFFIDKTIKLDKSYRSILHFFITVNIAYLIFFIF